MGVGGGMVACGGGVETAAGKAEEAAVGEGWLGVPEAVTRGGAVVVVGAGGAGSPDFTNAAWAVAWATRAAGRGAYPRGS